MIPLEVKHPLETQHRPIRVLLADDELDVRKMIERRLAAKGYEVIVASDGEQALRLARDRSPDVLVLDIMMPKLPGDAVASELKNDSRTASIPVIFLTCLVGPDEAAKSEFHIGRNLVLPKPLESARLITMIEALVQR